MLTHKSQRKLFFCVAAVPKTANASPSGVVNHEFIFMLSPSSRSTAKPAAAWGLRRYFYLLETLQSENLYSIPNLPQPPQISNTLKCTMAALACKKNLYDCPGSCMIIYSSCRGNHINFFRRCFTLNLTKSV